MINLLLIDPHPVVRCGFENFLSEYNFLNVVHTAEDLADGIAFTKSNPVDIVISEMILNDESPVDLIHQIKKYQSRNQCYFFYCSRQRHL
jgi:DNA-binding NarL/FixJ family response regulator